MTKLVTGVLVATAFLAAVWLVLWRRPGRARTGRFAALVAMFVAMLGGCEDRSGATKPNPQGDTTAAEQEAKPVPSDPKAIHKEIRSEMARIKSLQGGPSAAPEAMHEGKVRMGTLLAPLVKAGELSRAAADVLIAAHADLIYHRLRSQATCYMVYPAIASRRDGVEARLKLLADAEQRGSLKPEVLAKAKLALARGLEVIVDNRVIQQRSVENEGKVPEADQEMWTLINDRSKPIEDDDRIKVRPEVAEARDFLVGLLAE